MSATLRTLALLFAASCGGPLVDSQAEAVGAARADASSGCHAADDMAANPCPGPSAGCQAFDWSTCQCDRYSAADAGNDCPGPPSGCASFDWQTCQCSPLQAGTSSQNGALSRQIR